MTQLMAFLGAGSAGVVLGSGLALSNRLRQHVGIPLAVTLINFGTGFTLLAIYLSLGFGGPVPLQSLGGVPLWAYLGGMAGAAYVTLSLVAVPRIGLAASTIAIVSGQLIVSLAIDAFGLLGLPSRPAGARSLGGMLLLLLAVALTQFDRMRGGAPPGEVSTCVESTDISARG